MSLVLVGISHRTAPLEVRERHAVAPAAAAGMNAKLVRYAELAEGAVVSTCNRTELIAVADDASVAAERLFRFLRDEIGDRTLAGASTYCERDADCVLHVFRVAASLESMVLGEAQILGQLKDAWRAAVEASSCGPVLHRLFQRAFRTAKRVRATTGLGAGAVSLARVGVGLAREIFETFEGKSVLLVGAGEMAESALHGLREAGVRHVVVVNRSSEPARRLAERTGGRAAALGELARELARADVAIASLALDRPLITRAGLAEVMARRQGRPLLLVDLGLPRNVEPRAGSLDDVYLYDLDDLDRVAAQGRAGRAQALPAAEAIVREECFRFERWRAGLAVVPVLRALREHAEAVARAEVERSTAGADPAARAALERAAAGIVARLLHAPLERLRAEAEEGEGRYFADAARALFGLEGEEED